MATIGRYEIVDKIGQGGMGTVYKAFDPQLRRTVAVKLISAVLDAKSQARERFFREARAAGQLSHRNIIVIYDLGEAEGRPFLAMEHLTGASLETRVTGGGRLSTAAAVDVMVAVCDALEYAHARGVVHRDIKPANLFVTDTGEVKILDFGLAHLVSSELTRSDTIVGTANYMAPEQVRGERVDRRADIFSAGVVLYELLTGRKAFEGDSFANTLYKIIETVPEPVHVHDPTIPLPLAAVVDRALAKRKEDRYQTAAEMMRELLTSCESLKPVNRHLPTISTLPTTIERIDRVTTARGVPGSAGAGARTPSIGPVTDAPLSAPGRRPGSMVWSPRRIRTTAIVGGVLAFTGLALLIGPQGEQRVDPSANPTPAPVTQAVTPPPAPAAAPPAVAEPTRPTPEPAARPPARPARQTERTAPPIVASAASRVDAAVAAAANKERADTAIGRVSEARRLADASDAVSLASAPYRGAIGMEGEARGLYAAGEFARAAARALEAEAMFRSAEIQARAEEAAQERLRMEPAPPPPPAVTETPPKEPLRASDAPVGDAAPPVPVVSPAVDPRDAIRASIDQYVAALEARSVAALKQVWPSLSSAQERAIRSEFGNARSLQVRLTDPRIEVNGQTATVSAMRQYELVTTDGQRLATNTRMTMRLRRSGSTWVIESVSYQ